MSEICIENQILINKSMFSIQFALGDPDSYRDELTFSVFNYSSSSGSTMLSMASASLKSKSVTPSTLCVDNDMVSTL